MAFRMCRESWLPTQRTKSLTQALGLHPQLSRRNKEPQLHSSCACSCSSDSGFQHINCLTTVILTFLSAFCFPSFLCFLSHYHVVQSNVIFWSLLLYSSSQKHCQLHFRMRKQILVKQNWDLRPCLTPVKMHPAFPQLLPIKEQINKWPISQALAKLLWGPHCSGAVITKALWVASTGHKSVIRVTADAAQHWASPVLIYITVRPWTLDAKGWPHFHGQRIIPTLLHSSVTLALRFFTELNCVLHSERSRAICQVLWIVHITSYARRALFSRSHHN
jgi:hypothetical protein